jgi:pimeloyl-ACP methyl ester carboxylesterase
MDGRYDLAAMADDAETIIGALGIKRYLLAGHSMGGKVAQIIAAGLPEGLAGSDPHRARTADADAGAQSAACRHAGLLWFARGRSAGARCAG